MERTRPQGKTLDRSQRSQRQNVGVQLLRQGTQTKASKLKRDDTSYIEGKLKLKNNKAGTGKSKGWTKKFLRLTKEALMVFKHSGTQKAERVIMGYNVVGVGKLGTCRFDVIIDHNTTTHTLSLMASNAADALAWVSEIDLMIRHFFELSNSSERFLLTRRVRTKGFYGDVFQAISDDQEKGHEQADRHRINKRFILHAISKQSRKETIGKFQQLFLSTHELHHPLYFDQVAIGETVDSIFALYGPGYKRGSSLFHNLNKHRRLPEEVVRFYVLQLIRFLDYLHTLGHIFQSLSPESLWLDSRGSIAIRDPLILMTRSIRHLSLSYLPPESLDNGRGGPAGDCWRLGVLLYELLAGFPPIRIEVETETFQDDLEKYRQKVKEFDPQTLRIPPWLSVECQEAIRSLLHVDPNKRAGALSITDLRELPFFNTTSAEWHDLIHDPTPPKWASPSLANMSQGTEAAPASIQNFYEIHVHVVAGRDLRLGEENDNSVHWCSAEVSDGVNQRCTNEVQKKPEMYKIVWNQQFALTQSSPEAGDRAITVRLHSREDVVEPRMNGQITIPFTEIKAADRSGRSIHTWFSLVDPTTGGIQGELFLDVAWGRIEGNFITAAALCKPVPSMKLPHKLSNYVAQPDVIFDLTRASLSPSLHSFDTTPNSPASCGVSTNMCSRTVSPFSFPTIPEEKTSSTKQMTAREKIDQIKEQRKLARQSNRDSARPEHAVGTPPPPRSESGRGSEPSFLPPPLSSSPTSISSTSSFSFHPPPPQTPPSEISSPPKSPSVNSPPPKRPPPKNPDSKTSDSHADLENIFENDTSQMPKSRIHHARQDTEEIDLSVLLETEADAPSLSLELKADDPSVSLELKADDPSVLLETEADERARSSFTSTLAPPSPPSMEADKLSISAPPLPLGDPPSDESEYTPSVFDDFDQFDSDEGDDLDDDFLMELGGGMAPRNAKDWEELMSTHGVSEDLLSRAHQRGSLLAKTANNRCEKRRSLFYTKPKANSQSSKVCRSCGAGLKADAVFCSECGTKQEQEEEAEVTVVKEPSMCQACGKEISAEDLLETDEEEVYHKVCFEELGNTLCDICHQLIHDEITTWGTNNYHARCFVCSVCGDKINNEFYLSDDGHFICVKHIESPTCAGCNKGIEGSQLTFGGRKWHPQCFKCASCGCLLNGKPIYEVDGKVNCGPCRVEKQCPKCQRCNKPVNGSGMQLTIPGSDEPIMLHPECLVCSEPGCGKDLRQIGAHFLNGELVCELHARPR